MRSRARAFSLAVDGVDNLRPPHGPCPPTYTQLTRYLTDFDAALAGQRGIHRRGGLFALQPHR